MTVESTNRIHPPGQLRVLTTKMKSAITAMAGSPVFAASHVWAIYNVTQFACAEASALVETRTQILK